MSNPSLITEDDAREYSESLAQVTQGWWRLLAWAFRQGIPESLGMSRREWAESYHGYLKLPVPERREAIAELTAEGLNNSEIADALGVNERTVRRDADSASAEPDIEKLQIDGVSDESDSASAEPSLTLAEQQEIQQRKDREDAVRRIAEGLQAIISHWFKLENLPRSELREEVIGSLTEHDRERLREIADKIGVRI